MATHHDDDAADPGTNPPAENEAKTTPDDAEKPARPSPEKAAKPAAKPVKPAVKPAAGQAEYGPGEGSEAGGR